MYSSKSDLTGLIEAVQHCQAEDSMTNPLTNGQWEVLAPYLSPTVLAASQTLFAQGSPERTLFFIESGSLSAHFEDSQSRIRMAIIGPGSVVGEGAFFSHRPRSATVQAVSTCQLWALPAIRFAELGNRQPSVALALAMMVGSVLAKRMSDRKRRVAAT